METPNNPLLETIVFYAIINHENKFLRRKGYGGYGNSWIDNIGAARIYPKIGTAKAQITFWGKNYPQYPTPKLVEITGSITSIIEQGDRVKNAIDKERELENRHALYRAQIEYERAKKNYEKLLK